MSKKSLDPTLCTTMSQEYTERVQLISVARMASVANTFPCVFASCEEDKREEKGEDVVRSSHPLARRGEQLHPRPHRTHVRIASDLLLAAPTLGRVCPQLTEHAPCSRQALTRLPFPLTPGARGK